MATKKETTSNRLKEMARQSSPSATPVKRAAIKPSQTPPMGERGDFEKVSITMSPELYGLALDAVTLAKKKKQKGVNMSVIMRAALEAYLPKYMKDLER